MSKDFHIDTSKFDDFMNKRGHLKKEYDAITKEYKKIAKTLLKDWEGIGAEAFKEDYQVVITNLSGLGEILNTMCDILADCKDVIEECDNALASANKDAIENK